MITTFNNWCRSILSHRIVRKKAARSIGVLLCVFITFLILFETSAPDYAFLIAGGVIGFLASFRVLVAVILGKARRRLERSYSTLLFWRGVCDIGLALRFIATPWFNYALCGNVSCVSNSSDQSLCGFPSALAEFFAISSEAWFFCSGVDLYVTITDPFSSFKNRVIYYHIFSWGVSLIFTLSPFLSSNVSSIYGFWNFNGSRDKIAICWINTQSLQTPAWGMVIVPTALGYFACIYFLFIAYKRLKSGLSKTFLARMNILIVNSVILVVFMIYWTVLLLFYMISVALRGQHYGFNRLVLYLVPMKGVMVLFILIIIADFYTQLAQKEDNVGANIALRQEVLMFATVGIRTSARDAHTVGPEKVAIHRRPKQVTFKASNDLVTPLFFARLVLGFHAEISAVENAVQSNIVQTPTLNEARQSVSSSSSSSSIQPSSSSENFFEVNPINSISHMVGNALKVVGEEPDVAERQSVTSKRRIGSTTAESVRGSDLLVRDTHEDMENYEEDAGPGRLTVPDLFHLWSSSTLFRTSEGVKFTEFAPYYFRQIRYASDITDDVYIYYFSKTLKERLSEGGASGSLFFFSRDELFIAKSCKREELMTITSNAKRYCEYLCANKNSYISKIYGNDLCFFVMSNIYKNSENRSMHEKYDIKGSWLNRNSKPPRDGQSVTCMHCEQKFIYHKQRARTLRNYLQGSNDKTSGSGSGLRPLSRAISRNGQPTLELPDEVVFCTEGLNLKNDSSKIDEEGENIDDLLCPHTVNGIHEPNVVLKDNDLKYKIRLSAETARDLLRQLTLDVEFLYSIRVMDYSLLIGVNNTDYEVADRGSRSTLHRNSDVDSTTIGSARRLEVFRVVGPCAYYIGIIDYQQKWTYKKQFERFFKIHFRGADPDGVSSMEPYMYKERFIKKLEDILEF